MPTGSLVEVVPRVGGAVCHKTSYTAFLLRITDCARSSKYAILKIGFLNSAIADQSMTFIGSELFIAIVSIVVGGIVGVVGTYYTQKQKFEAETELIRRKIRAEFETNTLSARAIQIFSEWEVMRKEIKKKIHEAATFSDEENNFTDFAFGIQEFLHHKVDGFYNENKINLENEQYEKIRDGSREAWNDFLDIAKDYKDDLKDDTEYRAQALALSERGLTHALAALDAMEKMLTAQKFKLDKDAIKSIS